MLTDGGLYNIALIVDLPDGLNEREHHLGKN